LPEALPDSATKRRAAWPVVPATDEDGEHDHAR